MMTTKEEAQELIKKMGDETERFYTWEVKACALIAVEWAREQFYKYCAAEMGTDGTYDDHFDQLKQEIEKL